MTPHPHPLFAYGTLLSDHLRQCVLGRATHTRAATLAGYRRVRLRGRAYPAIVATAGASTTGRLVLDLTTADWARLDEYEGALYRREAVQVIAGDVRPMAAVAFVLASGREDLIEAGTWTLDEASLPDLDDRER